MRQRIFLLFTLFFLTFGITTSCSPGTQTSNIQVSPLATPSVTTQSNADDNALPLRIWWAQGLIPEENAVITKLVSDWEKTSGIDADISLMQDINIKGEVEKALAQGNPPDILLTFTGDYNLYPRLAWDGQLADVSGVLEPIKNAYVPAALESVRYRNNVVKNRSYYGVPIGQQELHTMFWRDLIEEANLTVEDIPRDWQGFWAVWKQAQDNLRVKGKKDIYGLGMTVSDVGTDNFWQFEHILEAFNVKIVNEQGELIIDNPQAKQGIVNTFRLLSDIQKKGYNPPEAIRWGDPTNNFGFLSRQVIMTQNPTVSIPLSQKLPDNIYNKNSRDRYFNKIVTIQFPNKPDGSPMVYLASIRQVVMFSASKNQEAGQKFLNYLVKPENLNIFLKEANKGRIFPVLKDQLNEPFWNNPEDPHLSAAAEQYRQPSRLLPIVNNPAYSQVPAQQVWGKALVRIIRDNISPEQAAEEAIADIKEIFTAWK